LSLKLYTIGIDASIKADNPDMSLLEEALSIADNDPTILLRSLAIKIYELERNCLNNIRVKDVIDDICMSGRVIEEKIHENHKFTRDSSRFNEKRISSRIL
jgi:hypothetical protein